MKPYLNLAQSTQLQFALVRTGSTEVEDQGRILGSLDLPLSQTGHAEVRQTVSELGKIKLAAIYSSACLAAKETARFLAKKRFTKVRVISQLSNLDYGLWHGRSIEELRETHPRFYRQWQQNPACVCPPEGETVETVRERVELLLKKICRKHKQGTIAIVAPDPLLTIIRCEIENKTYSQLDIESTPGGSWQLVIPRPNQADNVPM